MEKTKTLETLDRDKTIEFDSRDLFRQTLDTKNIHKLPTHLVKDDYKYRAIIFTYKHDPERVQNRLKDGWEFVVAAADDVDDRSAATKSETNNRPSTIECKFSSGHKGVWMKIKKDKLREREVAKRKGRLERMVQAGQISSTQDGYKILGPEYKHSLED